MIAAAALAAGVVTSQAQVYSQNIVGYVNSVVPFGYSVQSAPFDAANGNSATNIVINNPVSGPGTGPLDGAYLYVWGGSSFAVYTFDSTQPTGFADAGDNYATNAPVLNPGTAFYINNGVGAYTNTYVGTVHIGSGTYPGTSTNVIGATQVYTFISPVIPVGGGLTSVCGFTNVLSAGPGTGNLDGDYVNVPAITNGVIHGYIQYTVDSTQPTGYADPSDSFAVPEPQIPVAGGFLFNNTLGTSYNWIQTLGQ